MNYKYLAPGISLTRLAGLIRKEFILVTRDRGTIAMLAILPIMLLILFGFAIQFDPKHLPTTIISYDNSPLTRSYVSALEASGYFKVTNELLDEDKKNQDLANGKISFAFTIPPDFTRKYIRKENPQLLVEIDGSDPGSSASALSNALPILNQTLNSFNQQGLGLPSPTHVDRSVNLTIHRLYNESNTSSYNIVPGLIGVLLTLTMVMLTSTAITSEKESGTMEMLLSTPLKPLEIILGKVIPYIVLGYLQLTSVLIFGKLLIHIPTEGSLLLLYIAVAPFIIANLMVGMIFSTIAQMPMQAMQLSVFYQLPSMFLSGYIFSFYGMPTWAQFIGYCLPMTYFVRITRGILLKGNTLAQIVPNILPILLIAFILILLTGKIFRTKLD
ncbi:ABC transporter permease [Fluoribacter gormanii]|uniref:ABC-2 type transport system permease protein n=1 Tax=Fluoribacter gormanii TaxID=464 RepID=A0A377GME6_9GAMM|nr:ABC transporter permease [Fluoribacter gormanii]KTD05081.1 ABC transporter permease [Fluoribacter gormanii]MCW8445619.1 ABC transporter permease [Fluoribacter gormanii]MCW8470870.1 ABC transporter permease [Fluoribacter gormanii]SIQ98194.1 ABC-2 type transport system permease protein [Fluoribacter gormanii]STO26007.1 Inner membrane transport permease ybhS [Fluoribacter gormanii]